MKKSIFTLIAAVIVITSSAIQAGPLVTEVQKIIGQKQVWQSLSAPMIAEIATLVKGTQEIPKDEAEALLKILRAEESHLEEHYRDDIETLYLVVGKKAPGVQAKFRDFASETQARLFALRDVMHRVASEAKL
jgi:hypothetical protein